tara:strand:- start:169 stop:540 length:372 start_codon:yes stop_codon:yes gene_type:complete
MRNFLGILILSLTLSSCSPDPENFVGMDSSWIKPLTILFIICAVIVLIFVILMNHLHKKKYSFNFFGGLAFLAGPGIITFICYILMAVSGFLILSFFSNIIFVIAMLLGVGAFVVSYLENKKK